MPVILSKNGYEGNYMSTGNEYVSLPRISLNGSIDAVGFFSEEFDACLEFVGRNNSSFLSPFVNINEINILDKFHNYELENYWIPTFNKDCEDLSIKYSIFSPLARKGFICVLSIKNNSKVTKTFQAGYKGTWSNVHEICKSLRKLNFEKRVKTHSFEPSSLTFNIENISNIYSLCMYWDLENTNVDFCSLKTQETERDGDDIYFNIIKDITIKPEETIDIPLYVGIDKKEIGSISIVKELKHQGYNNFHSVLKKWLERHTIIHDTPNIMQLMNENIFYSFFYSQAITIDTNKLIITSAKDGKSSYCGLYLDADSMRWIQRASQLISWTQSRKHLDYALTTQSENIGYRSRTINGNILDMGVQLDAICSPIIGITNYIDQTGDKSILFSTNCQDNINYIQRLLVTQLDNKNFLCETLISPGGNYSSYSYICMQNVLVWKTYKCLSLLYNIIRDIDRSREMEILAEKVKDAIMKNFVKESSYGKIFCYATNLGEDYIFGNSKTFSLRLMPLLDFIDANDPIYKNTLKYLDNSEENIPQNSTEILHDIVNHLFINDLDNIHDIFHKIIKPDDKNFTFGTDPNAALSGLLAFSLFNTYEFKLPKTSIAMEDSNEEALIFKTPEMKLDNKRARIRG